MSAHEVVWTQDYQVSSFFTNPQKKLGLVALLNLLQDAAWIHATHLGHGFDSVMKTRMIWVLTRQKLTMKSWPEWGESLRIRTWVRPPQGAVATRDFEILLNDRVVGECTTSWLMMDMDTRRPSKRTLTDFDTECRTDYKLAFDAPKIELRADVKELAKFHVRNSDLDMNRHVNNTRYAQWVLDSVPLDWHRQYRLHEYEVNFLAETHAGDLITLLKSPAQAHFQGWREADQKTVFAARLQVSPV